MDKPKKHQTLVLYISVKRLGISMSTKQSFAHLFSVMALVLQNTSQMWTLIITSAVFKRPQKLRARIQLYLIREDLEELPSPSHAQSKYRLGRTVACQFPTSIWKK